MSTKIKMISVMHPFPHTVGPDQTLKVAREMMLEHNIRHLPVKSQGKLVGILSDRDIEFALRVDHKEPEQMKVSEAYIPEPFVTEPEALLHNVVSKMAHEHIGCALVVENGQLVGIFTTVDACRVLAEVLSGRNEQ